MPILEVDKAACVIVVKRSMRAGFAGIENELFFDPKTLMVFGDAKAVVDRAHQRGQRRAGRDQPLSRTGGTGSRSVRPAAHAGGVRSP